MLLRFGSVMFQRGCEMTSCNIAVEEYPGETKAIPMDFERAIGAWVSYSKVEAACCRDCKIHIPS